MDSFKARVNIEVQWASEQTIAAVERNGGVITTAYFDMFSVNALSDAKQYFLKGHPIPRRLTPTADAIAYYTDPANRGYLADPKKVADERVVLAQKYGYTLPEDVGSDDDMMRVHKDPRQVFYGLEPGWIVNLKDKAIYKPEDKDLDDYYKS
jgi:large subunit ribosomal protein L15